MEKNSNLTDPRTQRMGQDIKSKTSTDSQPKTTLEGDQVQACQKEVFQGRSTPDTETINFQDLMDIEVIQGPILT